MNFKNFNWLLIVNYILSQIPLVKQVFCFYFVFILKYQNRCFFSEIVLIHIIQVTNNKKGKGSDTYTQNNND